MADIKRVMEGKTVIVTGGAGGIGAQTSRLLAENGARVAITDLNLDAAQAVADEIAAGGGEAIAMAHDVSEEEDWQRVVLTVANRFGSVDGLVNNAGIFKHSPVESMPLSMFEMLCTVNLRGVFLGTKHVVAQMKLRAKDADSASIVNMSSTVGLIGSPFASIYSMTKGGVRLFTKSIALEVAQLGYNIRCNSVHPGVVETNMAALVVQRLESAGTAPAAIPAVLTALHPLGRLGQPLDVAEAVLFLVSNRSAFIAGTELVVDGGWTAR